MHELYLGGCFAFSVSINEQDLSSTLGLTIFFFFFFFFLIFLNDKNKTQSLFVRMYFYLFLLGAGLLATVASNPTNPNLKRSGPSYNFGLTRTSRLGRVPGGHRQRPYSVPLLSVFEDVGYLVNVTLGEGQETFSLILDTGSSDTWVIEANYTCLNQTTFAIEPQSACGFNPGYSPSNDFQLIPDVNYNTSYGQGTTINGVFGYGTLGLEGLNIHKQQMALGTDLYWTGGYGEGVAGILGMAFGNLTRMYAGTNFSADDLANVENYSPVVETIFFKENLTRPYFSLELSRAGRNASSAFGGYLEFGAVPDLNRPGWASVPIQTSHTPRNPTVERLLYYTIQIDGTVIGGSIYSANTSSQYIVDSGTTLMTLPAADAARINALFVPPAEIIEGYYTVPCNATAPQNIGMQIGGVEFPINQLDLINLNPIMPGFCVTGIQDGDAQSDGIYILGDVFLTNVLAVFDYRDYQIHFHAQ